MADMGWRVLDFTEFNGDLSCRRGQITVTPEEGNTDFVPFAGVAVILVGLQATISSALLFQLARNDICLLSCDWRGVPAGGFYSWSQHTRVGARQRAQMDATLPRRKNAWGRIVSAKVLGQSATLQFQDSVAAKSLYSLGMSVRSGDVGNIEAVAARKYWSALFGMEGFRRELDSRDCRNSHLNYSYAVLRGFGVRAVLSAGLSPALGLFHRNRSNGFNLVDDLIEPFRPAVDFGVSQLPMDAPVEDPVVKAILVDAASQPFDADGYTVPSVLGNFAQTVGRYLEGDEKQLKVPTWNGPPGFVRAHG